MKSRSILFLYIQNDMRIGIFQLVVTHFPSPKSTHFVLKQCASWNIMQINQITGKNEYFLGVVPIAPKLLGIFIFLILDTHNLFNMTKNQANFFQTYLLTLCFPNVWLVLLWGHSQLSYSRSKLGPFLVAIRCFIVLQPHLLILWQNYFQSPFTQIQETPTFTMLNIVSFKIFVFVCDWPFKSYEPRKLIPRSFGAIGQ